MAIQKRILVVDDDRVFREYLNVVLSKAGYDVSLAEDGEKALRLAISDCPDLVLTDGLLPKLHGFELARCLKRLENPPRVVILTGVYKKSSYQQEAMADYGADALLHKPVELNELLSCIHSQLETEIDIAPDWEQETEAPRPLVC